MSVLASCFWREGGGEVKRLRVALLALSAALSLYAGVTGRSSSNAGTSGPATPTRGGTAGDPVGIADGADHSCGKSLAFALDEDGSIVRVCSPDPSVWMEYRYSSSAVEGAAGATYYPLTDIQGTIWGYVDSQNNVVASWQYDAWGNVVDEYIAPSAAALATLRYRFQGRERSAATGLINFRMRWYDAETGRWLSKDPIGLSGGLNLYAFCVDNPVNLKDPLGLCDGKKKEPEIEIDLPKGLLESIKATMPEGALDVAGYTTSATAIGTAKTTAQTLGAVPDVARVFMAAKDIRAATELLAENPERAIESKSQQLENREKSIRDKLRDFFNRGIE